MQNEPEKTAGNYNEYRSDRTPIPLPQGVINLEMGEQPFEQWYDVIATGYRLVTEKISEILGGNNKLITSRLVLPKVDIIPDYPDNSKVLGYFAPQANGITLVSGVIPSERAAQQKVFIHEFLHYLSHNGRDDAEQLTDDSPIALNNNLGFGRAGLDIREGKEGDVTSDYFLAFNEAVTEQLAIDILPHVLETYSDYRELLGQVIDDGVAMKLGSKNSEGIFEAWSKEQIKQYIYRCFFRGDLVGFTGLLKTTYSKFDISEQQFGLMTNKDDLPSVIERHLQSGKPHTPPPSPTKVAALVQQRLNSKTPADYITDIIDTGPDDGGDGESKYGLEYDSFVRENNILISSNMVIEGVSYEIDNGGLIVFRDSAATSRLTHARAALDSLLPKLKTSEVDIAYVNEQVDNLLFGIYRMSMLTDGFRDFYIYKHTLIDHL